MGILSRHHSGKGPQLTLTGESAGFSRGATELSHLPSYFESVLGVSVASVQGSQVCLECTGTLGVFEMVARPLEFLSSVKWRPPPLEVRRELRNSLAEEAGKWTLLLG